MSAAAEARAAPNGLTASFLSEETALEALARLDDAHLGDAQLFSPVPPSEAPMRTRLPAIALAMGLLGGAAAFGLQSYANVEAYPLDIGGRPPFSWPSFIPIAFGAGVLTVVLTTVIGAGALCGFLRYYDRVDETRAIRDAMIDRWVIVLRTANSEALTTARELLKQSSGARAIEEVEL
ncbi:MAG: DUF3341 domain-containing protein [Methylocystis sp.]